MKEKKLTPRQREIFDYISQMIKKAGIPPTIREIGKKFGISSTNGVRGILSSLVKKGYIKRKPLVSRGIELVKEVKSSLIPDDSSVSVPVLGRIAAGLPVLAVENIEGSITLDKNFFTGERIFSLRVEGESMRNAGIFDGDYVVARHQPSADKGDIVVAIIGDEATVKKYYPENGRVRLEPANPEFRSIIVERKAPGFLIAGKVIGLLRRM
ncbi:MAG: transcriptional repressor LexA [Candidatus Zixiibacteriota bacterium]